MQFAFQRLNFIPENVILFGWSIGGFASSYAATIYPDVKAVVSRGNRGKGIPQMNGLKVYIIS